MSPLARASARAGRRAFTLVELIGVMAIIAILAAIAVPATLRTIDRAAVQAEVTNLRRVGANVPLHYRLTGTLPTTANWATILAPYTDLPPSALTTNLRQMARVYLIDPAATPSPRAIILSSMRTGLALPPASAINTAARFQDIWQTLDGQVPTIVSWAGWTAWNAVGSSGDYLVIERINLTSALQTFTLTLNNTGASAVSYNLVLPTGSQSPQPVPVGISTLTLRTGDRLNLYRAAAGVNLGYTYVVSTHGLTFQWDGTRWTAP